MSKGDAKFVDVLHTAGRWVGTDKVVSFRVSEVGVFPKQVNKNSTTTYSGG